MPADRWSRKRLIYLFGIAGHAELSPAMRAVEEAGWEVVVPVGARASTACPGSSLATNISIG